MSPRSAVLAASAAAAVLMPSAGTRQDEQVFVPEIKSGYLDKLGQFEEKRDWKGFFEWSAHCMRRFGGGVVRTGKNSWTGLGEYLLRRISGLPPEAHEHYRLENDGRARAAFERARESGERRLLENAVDEFFFSSCAEEGLDTLANLSFEEGRLDDAVFYWDRLLRWYPGKDRRRHVVAAKIAHACAAAGDESGLDDIRRYAAAEGLDGPLVVGNRRTTLGEYLGGLRAEPPAGGPRPVKVPYVRSPCDPPEPARFGVRNEIRRWTIDFGAEAEKTSQRTAYAQRHRVSHILPACARIREREYVILSDGTTVVAVDPARVRDGSPGSGIYWRYALRGNVGGSQDATVRTGLPRYRPPLVGVTVDGEHAFAAMYSSAPRAPDQNLRMQFHFEGPTTIKCFHVPTGKLVWDTENAQHLDALRELAGRPEMGGLDVDQRNFFFTSPVLVRDRRIYVGVSSAPGSEEASRVLCLDRRTGMPLWITFLASVPGRGAMMLGQNQAWTCMQTLLTAHGGAVYAHTGLGVVAALNGLTGGIVWLARYPREQFGKGVRGYGEPVFSRPANPPLVWRGALLVLPQDGRRLLAFDRVNGLPLEVAPLRASGADWDGIDHLVGVVGDKLIAGGARGSLVVKLPALLGSREATQRQDGERPPPNAHSLVNSAVQGGRGTIDGGFLYLPVSNGLSIYDLKTSRLVDSLPWREGESGGNLSVAGRYLVVGASRSAIYTDAEAVKSEYDRRVRQSPPHPETLLEFGDVMRQNRRLDDAAEAYLAFIRAAEGDPRHEERVGKVRGDLHAIFLRRGEEAASGRDHALALRLYSRSRDFAPDAAAGADVVRRMAEQHEKLQRWEDAVGLYQELIENAPGMMHREGERLVRLWDLARRRIDEIVRAAPAAYGKIERRAAEALRRVGEGGVEALRDVMDRFPNSGAAREAWRKALDALRRDGKLEMFRSLFDEFRDRFGAEPDFGARKELLECLEKLGDSERLRVELARFGELFGDEGVEGDGRGEKVRQYVERRLGELGTPSAPPAASGPLRKVAVIAPPLAPGVAAVAVRPLRPLGLPPPGFHADHDLFACGPEVELRNVGENRRVWVFRPGGGPSASGQAGGPEILGASFTRDGALAVVWDDSVASVEAGTGRLRWRFAGVREGHAIRGFHAVDGRLLLYEGRQSDIDALRALRTSRSGRHDGRARGVIRAVRIDTEWSVPTPSGPVSAGEYDRLLCLNDSTGNLVWARTFDRRGPQPVKVHLMGAYLGGHAAILHGRPGRWEFSVYSPRDGEGVRKEVLQPQLEGHAVDPAGRVFYCVASFGDPSQRILRCIPVDPRNQSRRAGEIPLRGLLSPDQPPMCTVAAGSRHVCVAAPASMQAPQGRLLIWGASGGGGPRRVSLPEGRTLPRGWFPVVAVGDDGFLYVHNEDVVTGGRPGRAWLTALRAGAGGGEWAGRAPWGGRRGGDAWIVAAPPRYVIVASSAGRIAGRGISSPVALVYDGRGEGRICMECEGLVSPAGADWNVPGCPVSWWRGRLYVCTAKGIEVWEP